MVGPLDVLILTVSAPMPIQRLRQNGSVVKSVETKGRSSLFMDAMEEFSVGIVTAMILSRR